MKRVVFGFGGLIIAATLVTSCSSSSVLDGVSDVGDGTACADANLSSNMTAGEYAEKNARLHFESIGKIAGLDENSWYDEPGLAEYKNHLVETIGDLVDATPPGNQAEFAEKACKGIQHLTDVQVEAPTGTIALGYSFCSYARMKNDSEDGISPGSELYSDPISEDLETIIDQADSRRSMEQLPLDDEDFEYDRAISDAAYTYLCPQLPRPQTVMGAREYCDQAVEGSSGLDGAVLVAIGDVDCDEAVEVITDAFKQIDKSSLDGVSVSDGNTLRYICSGPIPSSDGLKNIWDYKCESPMGDTVIVWNSSSS